jgi:hypothetical protein
LTTLSPSVAVAVPTLAVTVRVVPLPVTPVIEAPEDPVPVSSKLPAAPPVIALLKVTVQLTVAALVGLLPTRVTERTEGGRVKVSPVPKGSPPTGLLSASAIPVELAILNPIEPRAVPRSTVTVRVVPLPVTPVIAAVPRLLPVRAKLLAAPPVTLSLKVTRKLAVVPVGGLAPTRVIETTRGAIE